MEEYLMQIAQNNKVKMYGLESDSIMLSVINATTSVNDWEQNADKIHDLLLRIEKGKNKKNICNNAVNYMNFNLDYKFNEKCSDNVLLKTRNEKWLLQLPQLLADNNCFIAVGLLHLYGQCGLISQLREKGYIIEPIMNLRKQ